MRRRRRRPPVLARVPGRQGGVDLRSLDRGQLEACARVRAAIGGSRVALVTRDAEPPVAAVGIGSAAVAEGRSAVVVECHIDRPLLAGALGLAAAPGLADYLRGRADAQEVLQPIVLAGPAAGRALEPLLAVVAGLPATDGPALLASEGFGHAIGRLRNAYDLVVLDAPTLEDDQTIAVARHADVIYACTVDGRTPRRLRRLIDGVVVVEPAG